MLRNYLMFDLKFWRKLSRKLKKSFTLGIVAVTMCTAILASCTKAEPPLRVGANVWPGYETLYLARSLGYYDNTPIRLVDYPSGTEEVRAYRNGEIEAAGISIDQALVLAATNPDVKIVVVMDFSDGGDVILGKPEIQNMQGLKNKPVGVESTALGAFIITRALEQKGMSPQDIKIVSLGVSEHERAFKSGKVDAVVTFGSARTNLLKSGAKLLFDSSQIPGEIVDVLIVRDEVIQKQPKALQALVDGRFRALDYLTKNPQDAAIKIAPRTGITPEQFLESLKGLRSPDLQENQKLLGKTDPSLLNGVKRLSQVMLENKLLPKAVDPAPLLDDRLVKNVKF
jgi:NitT/TauT family transport system substrate-binding protein